MGINADAMRILCEYAWPGNVRELRNLVESMVVLSPGKVIGPDDIPPQVRSPGSSPLLPVRTPGPEAAPGDAAQLRPQLEFVFRTLVDLRVDMDDLRREFEAYRQEHRYDEALLPGETGRVEIVAPRTDLPDTGLEQPPSDDPGQAGEARLVPSPDAPPGRTAEARPLQPPEPPPGQTAEAGPLQPRDDAPGTGQPPGDAPTADQAPGDAPASVRPPVDADAAGQPPSHPPATDQSPAHAPVSDHGPDRQPATSEDAAEASEAPGKPEPAAPPGGIVLQPGMTLEEIERKAILAALEEVEGSRRHAARLLGVAERTLYRKIRRYGLD